MKTVFAKIYENAGKGLDKEDVGRIMVYKLKEKTVDVEIKIKNALTESGAWWKPIEMQFIKWTTEGMVKG